MIRLGGTKFFKVVLNSYYHNMPRFFTSFCNSHYSQWWFSRFISTSDTFTFVLQNSVMSTGICMIGNFTLWTCYRSGFDFVILLTPKFSLRTNIKLIGWESAVSFTAIQLTITWFACEISPRGVFIVAKFRRQKGISSIVFSLEMYAAQLTH